MKLFVTGATGYIGGSIAEKLMASGHEVAGLARSEEKGRLLRERGIDPVIGSLDDPEVLTGAAQAADAVIHAANADHSASVVTLVTALERSGKLLIATTGSAIVADHADGEYAGAIHLTEDSHFDPVPYRRPRVDMNRYVRQAAIEKGVRSVVVCPSMIFGPGRGLQTDSDQIPKLIALSRQVGAGVYFGKGRNRYSNVHIDDLVDLYLLVLEKAPGGSFFFAENGDNSFKEIAGMISTHIGAGGETVSLPLAEVTRQYGEAGRLGVASNSLVKAVNARRLGWSPKAPSLEQWFKTLTPEVVHDH
jgi:nucleoside-diphosphate-sugar epimerase